MHVIKLARVPAPSVEETTTVKEAVPLLLRENGCAIGVVREGRLLGTFSQQDLMDRVVRAGLDPATTPVRDVMNESVVSVPRDMETKDALRLLQENDLCSAPVVRLDGTLEGWLAICHLHRERLDDLGQELDSLEAYLSTDGPGG